MICEPCKDGGRRDGGRGGNPFRFSFQKKDQFDSMIAKITARCYVKHVNIAMVDQVSNQDISQYYLDCTVMRIIWLDLKENQDNLFYPFIQNIFLTGCIIVRV